MCVTSALAIENSNTESVDAVDNAYIKSIEISGNSVIKPENILEQMQLQAGS